jgi:hypothetical protein
MSFTSSCFTQIDTASHRETPAKHGQIQTDFDEVWVILAVKQEK